MPFNGSGVYSAPSLPGSFNPAISGQDATPDDWNTLLADLSTALSTMITRNGESTVTQNIPMSGYKFTGIGDATARTQFPSVGQIQDGYGVYAAAGGTADALTLTLSPAITVYAVGQRFRIKQGAGANTTAVTLNVNGIGAGDVKWPDGTALGAGAIPANAMFDVEVADISTPTAPVFHLQTVASPFDASGDTMTGTLTMSGAAINEAGGADLASASTVNIGADGGNYIFITGNTTINAFDTVQRGVERTLVFLGTPILTYSGAIVLPTAADIQVQAGDRAIFRSNGSGNWECISYTRATGKSLSSVFAVAPYVSSDTSYTNGSTTAFTHGLGTANLLIQIALVCQSNEGGYTTGQVVLRQPGEDQTNVGISVVLSSTSISITVAAGGMYLVEVSGSYGMIPLTPAKWKIRVIAFAY